MKSKKEAVYLKAIKQLIAEQNELMAEISNRQLSNFSKYSRDGMIGRLGLNLDTAPVYERSITNPKQAATTGKALVKKLGRKIFAVLVDPYKDDFITGILEIPTQGRIHAHGTYPGNKSDSESSFFHVDIGDTAMVGGGVAQYAYFFTEDDAIFQKRKDRAALRRSQKPDELSKKGPSSVYKDQYYKRMDQLRNDKIDRNFFKRDLRNAQRPPSI